ncbi:type I-E CRISPR-associated protein Cse2/CasB [Streptomyces sp. NPDC057686]|uniref:type I-E CRISPR-associated protein Cse2/CasB n=1 Tax=Streptomyces sp. NPDC057686 TaxID=3346212 RepID=UPI00367ADD32
MQAAPRIPAPVPPPSHASSVGGPADTRELGALGQAVARRIQSLQYDYRHDRPQAVLALAQLRRGVGRLEADMPDLWGLVGMEQFHVAQPPGADEAVALRAERAVYAAMTLWALHQQSHRTKGMHVPDGACLGTAVRRLMPGTVSDESIRKRLVRAGAATTFDALAQRLRELVVLLHAAEIPLDYGLLAEHLEQWQEPGGPSLVRQAWGRGFHAHRGLSGPVRQNGASGLSGSGAGTNESKDQA